jgi:hypothetical protein
VCAIEQHARRRAIRIGPLQPVLDRRVLDVADVDAVFGKFDRRLAAVACEQQPVGEKLHALGDIALAADGQKEPRGVDNVEADRARSRKIRPGLSSSTDDNEMDAMLHCPLAQSRKALKALELAVQTHDHDAGSPEIAFEQQ